MRQLLITALIVLCISLSAPFPASAGTTETLLDQVPFREIGPWRGGRVTAVSGVPDLPQLYYMGAAGGGVWVTHNAGVTWENLSDGDFEVGTIGAIAVAPSDPKVLWVGTGEAPIRGVTTSHGDGVWRSTDGGSNWVHVGLEDAGQIARIVVHPDNPDTAWVAVQGQIWGPNEQRGVFKTTDGGQSWAHVLKVNPDTGATDLAMDPDNPRHLYAAMWHHGRTPWFIKSGGEGGGLYKSTDGGETWRQLENGLPEAIGKIGVAVAASNPSRVYAIVEAEFGKGGLYRSDNAGESWELMNDRRVLHARAWYYIHIATDPNDENTVWVMNVPLMKSIDGGKTFERVNTPHSDHHDHWINPGNSLNMISGNDGGATVTFDGGKTWSSQMNQPTAQFYRVATDRQSPFRLYGGQQDNTTVSIASASSYGGIGPEDYFDVGGGESAHIAFNPDQPDLIYATTINNTLTELDVRNFAYRSIVPYPEHVYGMDSKDLKYRANWNAPVMVSPHDPTTIYYGTQMVLRSQDRGRTWTEISPDLTRDEEEKQGRNGGPLTPENVGAEFYNTIFYLAESTFEEGTLWVGSDDGLVHLTRDGGESWSDITPAGAPEGMINMIELSPHDAGTAYIALARYKLNDFQPYIYVTTNYGNSWKRIDDNLPQDSFVRVVREDPSRRGLLFAGTEAGLYVSYNAGADWASMHGQLPPVPITDLAIRDDRLAIATQGRGFWIQDNLGLVSQLEQDIAARPLKLFQPRDQQLNLDWSGAGDFEGANPPDGLVLTYAIGDEAGLPLTLEILDAEGRLVRLYSSEESDFDRCRLANMDLRSPFTISYPATDAGLHQWEWDLRRQPLKCIENARNYVGHAGAYVLPGTYQARLTRGDQNQSVTFEITADPRRPATPAELSEWETGVVALTGLFNEITENIKYSRAARSVIEALQANQPGVLNEAQARAAIAALAEWEASVTQLKFDTYEDEDSWPTLVDGQVANLLSRVSSGGAPVSEGAQLRAIDLAASWMAARQSLETIDRQHIYPLNAQLGELATPTIPRPFGE